jgi:hypothetical protein
MRNSLICEPADTELDMQCVTIGMTQHEDLFATAPMIALSSTAQQLDEEEVYTSFEQAISDRARTISRQLSQLSGSVSGIYSRQRTTDALSPWLAKAPEGVLFGLHRLQWRRCISHICLALMLVLLGFDLMGLLVLLR